MTTTEFITHHHPMYESQLLINKLFKEVEQWKQAWLAEHNAWCAKANHDDCTLITDDKHPSTYGEKTKTA